jgi:hypothetical protein
MTEPIANGQWIHGVQPNSQFTHETGVYGTLGCGHYTIVAECGGHGCNREYLRESQQYNARLIAAAPDLLAALTLVLELFEWETSGSTEERAYDQGRAAIDKANGTSSHQLA